jgi:hypothetical protein
LTEEFQVQYLATIFRRREPLLFQIYPGAENADGFPLFAHAATRHSVTDESRPGIA